MKKLNSEELNQVAGGCFMDDDVVVIDDVERVEIITETRIEQDAIPLPGDRIYWDDNPYDDF